MRDAVNGHGITINGDGTPLRSYLYVVELVEWLFTLLTKAPNGAIYNVGSSDEISIRALADQIVQLGTQSIPVEVKTMTKRETPPERYIPDVSKISSEMGLIQKISLSEGLRRFKLWMEER